MVPQDDVLRPNSRDMGHGNVTQSPGDRISGAVDGADVVPQGTGTVVKVRARSPLAVGPKGRWA